MNVTEFGQVVVDRLLRDEPDLTAELIELARFAAAVEWADWLRGGRRRMAAAEFAEAVMSNLDRAATIPSITTPWACSRGSSIGQAIQTAVMAAFDAAGEEAAP